MEHGQGSLAMSVAAFAEEWPARVRRLGDGERVIHAYTYRGKRGWWGTGRPLGAHQDLWYFYYPGPIRPGHAITAVRKAAGPVVRDCSSDEEPYFWVTEAQMRVLAARGPKMCQIRRKRAVFVLPAGG